MPHGSIKDASFPVLARPSRGISRPVVRIAFHILRLLHEQHVQVGPEILQRIPLLLEIKARPALREARELQIHHAHRRHLLRTVDDELAAQHLM